MTLSLGIKASVVVPTKNPGEWFRRVLSSVLKQDTPWPYEIIVIDSGSDDGTIDYVLTNEAVRLLRISSLDFGHGRTRNHAIANAHGEYVALLTHDAVPLNNRWLFELVSALDRNPGACIAFGCHVAYDDADVFSKRDILNHFNAFEDQLHDNDKFLEPDKYVSNLSWRQSLHFYSDNNSCVRRSAWLCHKYPDVEYAEDQILASEMIRTGYQKIYVPAAIVQHSHNYTMLEVLQRSFDEAVAFYRLFGYRLSPLVRHMLVSIVGRTLYDVQYGRTAKVSIKHLTLRVLQNALRSFGHYLGANYYQLPIALRNRLSLDTKLRNSVTNK